MTLSAIARTCRGFVPEQITKKSVNPVALRRSSTARSFAFLSAAASIASETCLGRCVALRRFSALAMQPACRSIRYLLLLTVTSGDGRVKSVLLNMLLDFWRDQSRDR